MKYIRQLKENAMWGNAVRRLMTGVVLLGTIAFSGTRANAIPITGDITFLGLGTPTGGTGFGDATGLHFGAAVVFSATGDFGGLAGSPATFADFQFNPASTPVNPLWTAGAFSFELDSVWVDNQTASSLDLSGKGILRGPGDLEPTSGNWSFHAVGSDYLFAFVAGDSSNPTSGGNTSVPDGGATCVLLGTALIGLFTLKQALEPARSVK